MKKITKILFLSFLAASLSACSFDFLGLKTGTNTNTTINTGSNTDSNDNSGGTDSSDETTPNDTSSTTPEDDTNLYPESLTISGPKTLYIGQTVTYTVSFYPENVTFPEVNWFTTDSQKISVQSDGQVTGSQVVDVSLVASMKGPNNTSITATYDIHVDKAKISSLILSETKLELHPRETFQLSATYFPSYALQEYNWSSSDDDIASVNVIGLVTANSEGTATISVKTADNVEASCLVSVTKNTKTTIFVYMCGADLESTYDRKDGYNGSNYQGLASMDIDEILSVENQPSDVEIILETGGAKHWAKSEIDPSKSQRWEIRDSELIEKESSFKKNMGLSTTLQSFLEWGFENYSASHYGLVFWNHGGALTGVCFDENFSDDSLTHDEIAIAVSAARNNKNITEKLDWVVYDACLMAVQDVIEYNSQNFDYMLASQESENGYGYDYDAWLPSLYENPEISPAMLLEEIGHTFMIEEKEIYDYYNEPFDQTQSAFNLNVVQPYKNAFESFALKLDTYLTANSSKVQTLKGIIESSTKYGKSESSYNQYVYPFDIFDVESVLKNITKNSNFSFLSNDAQLVLEKLNDLVVYEEHGNATSGCGVCLFCPVSLYQYNYFNQGYDKGPETHFVNWSEVTEKIFQLAISNY